MEILKVENLTKTYGKGETKVVALNNVSFTAEKGEFIAIVGASGSGKSTSLRNLSPMETFIINVAGKNLSPQAYAQSLGLKSENFVSLTSFSHHPFYSQFAIEVPDNWRWDESYNIPLDELQRVLDNAIDKGYCVAWASDVSEKGFSRKGIAVNPETKVDNLPGSDQARWTGISEKDREEKIYKTEKPQPEVKVTQEIRQASFDNYQTTDDHGMVIFGTAKDQNGTKFYMVKNSWGTDSKYKGVWYASESFVLHKTMDIMVHKNAIPADVLKMLGLK